MIDLPDRRPKTDLFDMRGAAAADYRLDVVPAQFSLPGREIQTRADGPCSGKRRRPMEMGIIPHCVWQQHQTGGDDWQERLA